MNKAVQRLVAASWLLVLLAAPAGHAAAQLERGPEAVVTGVVDGDTVVLDDGSQVRLVGIQAPKLPLGRAGFEQWPLAPEAKAALARLVEGERVTLSYGGRRTDRHGRHLAHLHTTDGLWVQGELLRRGMARVYSFADNRALVREMLAIEREARAAGRGIWSHPYYAVRRVEETPRLLDTYQLVEARVLEANEVRGRVYLNFGMDWRSDFTISIDPRDRDAFEGSDVDPVALGGRLIRARGWLSLRNGPMLKVTHPEQIEVLE